MFKRRRFAAGCALVSVLGLGLFVLADAAGLIPDYAATKTTEALEKERNTAATAAALALTPSDTPTSTDTAVITSTITPMASSTFTPPNTQPPSVTPLPSDTPLPLTQISRVIYYALTGANLRACPNTSAECAPVAQLRTGDAIAVTGKILGEAVQGNTLWYQATHGGKTVYVHSSVMSENPVALPTWPAQEQPSVQQQPGQQLPPAQVPASSWDCGGNLYDCESFSSCADMWRYWNACPGDPSDMDGDGDGRPCEFECG